MYKNLVLILSLLLSTSFTLSNPGRLANGQFEKLALYAQCFLQNNFTKIACQKNESGFIRINIPLTQEKEDEFKGIKKLRLNYWSPETQTPINVESIHTHPYYFESYLINGGYTHELYAEGDRGDQKYDLYKIIKEGGSRSFAFIGEALLKYKEKQKVSQDSIVIFPIDLIHRVLSTEPNTLSLNAVFDDEERDAIYNVYLTKKGSLDDIKVDREIIANQKSKPFIQEIITILNNVAQRDR